jgi:predicted PurR-regulated permease PerM
LFCALIVGSVDNVLRPRLVGQDTQLHELFIFFSTLGGLMLFGAMGFILGPILAALFVTAWDMFGTTFRSALAEPGSVAADPDYRPPV